MATQMPSEGDGESGRDDGPDPMTSTTTGSVTEGPSGPTGPTTTTTMMMGSSDGMGVDDGNAEGDTTTSSTTTTEGSDSSDTDIDYSDCSLVTDFEGVANGAPWPEPWVITGGVEVADVVDGRGRLIPETSNYALGRLFAELPCTDVEGTLRFEFTQPGSQGIGYYIRHNGGHLEETEPPGLGYSGFVESFRNPGSIAVWREIGGDEQEMSDRIRVLEIEPNVIYRMRVRVTQQSAEETLVQARVWVDGEPEPQQWQAEAVDDLEFLQGNIGGIAVDAWSSRREGEAAEMFFDDIEVVGAL